MFDRAIIETDNFLNISLSAKALYFLLGMEADDEGFVSPNRVIRLYGGEMGDLKNLIDTGLVIPFQSGVVVITHWKENNWLDSRRVKETQYQEEKKMLLTQGNKYLLSIGSARGEEKSIEEKRDKHPLSYLKELTKEQATEMSEKFNCTNEQVFTKANALLDYCKSKGKVYKDYKAFLSNALRKDFGERPPRKKMPIIDTSSGQAVIVGYR